MVGAHPLLIPNAKGRDQSLGEEALRGKVAYWFQPYLVWEEDNRRDATTRTSWRTRSMMSINIMDGNECSHLAGIPRPSSCTPEWLATSEEDPPHSPHRLHTPGQLAGPNVKARLLPKHPPPYLPTYCTPEWPATRTGTCCTQPSTDESQTQSYDSYNSYNSYDSAIYQ